MACHSWRTERTALRGRIAGDASLNNIVAAIADSKEAWKVFRIFAETVMSAKEEAERQREAAAIEMGPFDGDWDDMDDESDHS